MRGEGEGGWKRGKGRRGKMDERGRRGRMEERGRKERENGLRGVKDWVHMKTAKMMQDFNWLC